MSRLASVAAVIAAALLTAVAALPAEAASSGRLVRQLPPKLKPALAGEQTILVRARTRPSAICRASVAVKRVRQALTKAKATRRGRISWQWQILASSPSGTWKITVRCRKAGRSGSAVRRVLVVTGSRSSRGPIGEPQSLSMPDGEIAGRGGGECGPFDAPPLKQCTCLAWIKRRDVYDTSVRRGVRSGGERAPGFYVWDGGQWLVNAQRGGFPTGSTPVEGALVVWGVPNSLSYGHVAYVDKVESATRVLIHECNYDWKGSCRKIWLNPRAKANFQGYVYGGHAGNGPRSNPPASVAGAGHLLAVNRRDSGSGRTAVHILDASRGFQAPSLLSVGTWLHQTDAQWDFAGGDYNGDGRTDVFAVNRSDSGSGKTAVHVLNGANRFQAPSLLSVGTWLHPTSANWTFTSGDYNRDGRTDIFAINKTDSGSGKTAVHVLNGANRFQAPSLLSVGTWLHQTGADWDFTAGDYNRDGRVDIYAINKKDSGSGATAVHVLDGANRFQSSLLSAGTWLHQTDGSWDFTSADFNRDGRTDILAVNKSDGGSGRTAVHVLNAATRFKAPSLLSTGTWLHPTDGNWMFVGG